jgi:hypothetical protein
MGTIIHNGVEVTVEPQPNGWFQISATHNKIAALKEMASKSGVPTNESGHQSVSGFRVNIKDVQPNTPIDTIIKRATSERQR